MRPERRCRHDVTHSQRGRTGLRDRRRPIRASRPSLSQWSYLTGVVRPKRVLFEQMLALTKDITFTARSDDLAQTSLVRAFIDTFELAAFASFAIQGLTPQLRSALKAPGDGIEGTLEAFAERLLACDDMHTALPDLALATVGQDPPREGVGFRVGEPLKLEGELAAALHHGGAYSSVTVREAAAQATDFRTRFIGDRYDDLVVLSGPGWSDWWALVTGDYGWLMTDLRSATVHVLCASGVD